MRGRSRWLRRHVALPLLVHKVDGQTITGLLVREERGALVMTACTYLEDSGGEVPLAGETWVPRDRVAFVQEASPNKAVV